MRHSIAFGESREKGGCVEKNLERRQIEFFLKRKAKTGFEPKSSTTKPIMPLKKKSIWFKKVEKILNFVITNFRFFSNKIKTTLK